MQSAPVGLSPARPGSADEVSSTLSVVIARDSSQACGDSESRVYFARVSGFATASALPDFFDGAAAAGFFAAWGGFLRRSSSGENIAVYL